MRHRGVVHLGSAVHRFGSSGAADADLSKGFGDATRFAGKEVEPGLHLDKVGFAAVQGVGDRAAATTEAGRFGHTRFVTTSVAFRIGTLVGTIDVVRADDAPVLDEAIRLAGRLADRIARVESGALHEQAVPLPATAKQGQPPAGGPALAPMALSLADLPPGARIARQGYVADGDSIGDYEREFGTLRVGGAELTGSRPTSCCCARQGGDRVLPAAALPLRLVRRRERCSRASSAAPATIELQQELPTRATTATAARLAAARDDRRPADPARPGAGARRARRRLRQRRRQPVVARVEDVQPLVAKFARRIAAGL